VDQKIKDLNNDHQTTTEHMKGKLESKQADHFAKVAELKASETALIATLEKERVEIDNTI